MEKPVRDIKEVLLSILSRREYCRFDAENKLKQKGYPEEDIQNALDWALKRKYIDDARYCKIYVECAFKQKHQGKKRIAYDLRYKHIDSHLITAALTEFYPEESEKEELTAMIDRRLNGDFSEKSKNRVIRYLLSHGFEFSMIKSIMDTFSD